MIRLANMLREILMDILMEAQFAELENSYLRSLEMTTY